MIAQLGLLSAGFGLGAVIGRKLLERSYPTLQEKIDAVMKTASPATAEDLLRLIGARCVARAGVKFSLSIKIGDTRIETPLRDHLALVIPDIESFERQVAAVKAAQAEALP